MGISPGTESYLYYVYHTSSVNLGTYLDNVKKNNSQDHVTKVCAIFHYTTNQFRAVRFILEVVYETNFLGTPAASRAA